MQIHIDDMGALLLFFVCNTTEEWSRIFLQAFPQPILMREGCLVTAVVQDLLMDSFRPEHSSTQESFSGQTLADVMPEAPSFGSC